MGCPIDSYVGITVYEGIRLDKLVGYEGGLQRFRIYVYSRGLAKMVECNGKETGYYVEAMRIIYTVCFRGYFSRGDCA
jgi:hypothetical protein